MKCTPARAGWFKATSEIAAASPGTRLTTPGGRPASCRSCISQCADSIAVDAGFQMTVLPMSAGAVGRLAPMAVKLNGVTA